MKQLPHETCPACGYKFDCATCISDGKHNAKPGDLTLCLCCGELFVFDNALRIQTPSVAYLAEASQKTMDIIDRAQKLIRRTRPIKL